MFKSLLLKGRTLGLLLCCLVSSLAVTAQVKHTGKVIGSDDKLPVVGASIRIKGTNTGAVTDVNGDFTLALSPGNVLVVSYIGYVTQEVTVRGGEFLTISLAPSSSTLNEVVVTGYQTQVKKDITGAVGLVDVQDAKKLEVNSSEQLLQGQVSGVSVINDGAPGSPSTVFIRGISNFGVTTPLYVIDGVQTSSMSEISPSDIESIAVLKDAGAAAIYGVSGGNGVIVITTKHGKAGKTQLSYDAFFADQTPLSGNVFHLMDPTQQSILTYQADDPSAPLLYPGGPGVLPTYGYHGGTAYTDPAGTNFGVSGVTNNPGILGAYHYDASNASNDFLVQKFDQQGTDWFHALFKDAPEQRQTITASGGNDHSTFLYSLDYLNDEGTLIETFEKRYSARVNNTYSFLNNHLRFGESGYVYYENNNGGYNGDQQQEGGSISYIYRALPIIPLYDVAGNYGGTYDGPTGEPLGNGTSPLQIQQQQANQFSKNENIQGLLFAEADIAKYFTVRTAFGGNYNSFAYNSISEIPYSAYESHANPTGYSEVDGFSSAFNFTNTLNYKETFGKSAVTAFAGYEIRETGGQQLGASATNFPFLTTSYLTVATTTAPATVNLSSNTYLYQPTGTESIFGRVDYGYDDKYLLSGTVRRDGFSAFFPGKQWGTFPSATAGWRISKEDFMKGISWIQDLKLRGSYGELGSNANIKANSIYNTYSSGFGSSYYGIGGALSTITPGYQQQSIGNPATTWETDKVLNVGVDASLFNHLDFSLEYYKKQSTNLLFAQPLPATAGGATSPIVNNGSTQNTGFDFSATYHDQIGKDFRFSITGNLTSYKSEITSLPNGTFYLFAGNRIGNPFVAEAVGEPIGEFYGYKVQGIYQNTAQLTNGSVPMMSGASVGSYIYQAQNGDKTIGPNDETYIGNPNPDFTYGVNLNASYKGFDFSMVLYGSQGNKDFNYVKWWTDTYQSFPGGKQTNLLTDAAIVKDGVVTNPGATLQANSVDIASPPASSFYVENGSFLKCRVLSVGYNINPGILRTIGVSKVHVYVQGTNLFTITKYTGLDPELLPSVSNSPTGPGSLQSASTGVDWGAYPTNQKVFSVGVNATL